MESEEEELYVQKEYDSLPLIHPSTVQVCGPTGCGKTLVTARLLLESKFEPSPERIMWVYSEWQPLYDEIQELMDIEFIKGFSSSLYDTITPDTTNLIVLDDQMSDLGDSKYLLDLFTKGSHHRNLTVIFIVQNIYHTGKSMRTASINTQYQIIFKSPRDMSQVARLGEGMFPKHKKFLPAVLEHVSEEPFGYVLADVHPKSNDKIRVRAPIFTDQQNYVYQPI